jgi:hypothetical protein
MDALLKNIPHADELPENKDKMWVAVGCPKCGGVGYKGRIGIVEVILMDKIIEECVRTSSSEHEIWKAAKHQNIRRMAQDGAVKVNSKASRSLDELGRVVNLKDESMLEQFASLRNKDDIAECTTKLTDAHLYDAAFDKKILSRS